MASSSGEHFPLLHCPEKTHGSPVSSSVHQPFIQLLTQCLLGQHRCFGLNRSFQYAAVPLSHSGAPWLGMTGAPAMSFDAHNPSLQYPPSHCAEYEQSAPFWSFVHQPLPSWFIHSAVGQQRSCSSFQWPDLPLSHALLSAQAVLSPADFFLSHSPALHKPLLHCSDALHLSPFIRSAHHFLSARVSVRAVGQHLVRSSLSSLQTPVAPLLHPMAPFSIDTGTPASIFFEVQMPCDAPPRR